jgi:protein arginine kinase activator
MNQEFNEESPPEEKLPERPLECSECKKPIVIRYTEMEKGKMIETSMCQECPCLQRKLRGVPSIQNMEVAVKAGLACGDCGTTLESFQMGHPLGCTHCYEVFTDPIIQELHTRGRLPAKINSGKKSLPLHLGRSPGESVEISPSMQLITLNEALNEMLKREDYEQAAMIRDQIKALKQNSDKEKKETEENKGKKDEGS